MHPGASDYQRITQLVMQGLLQNLCEVIIGGEVFILPISSLYEVC